MRRGPRQMALEGLCGGNADYDGEVARVARNVLDEASVNFYCLGPASPGSSRKRARFQNYPDRRGFRACRNT